MSVLPTIFTSRLAMRPFEMVDAARVQLLAGDADVAAKTELIPHPYPDGAAQQWISEHKASYQAHKSLTLAVVLRQDNQLIGAMNLGSLSKQHQSAELGYWIGKPYWSLGYGTEAAAAMVQHGFDTHALHRINGRCLRSNQASAKVMRKTGFVDEGCLRESAYKSHQFQDVLVFGLLRSEWLLHKS